MRHTNQKAQNAILRVLSESENPIGASQLAARLLAMGIDLCPRTVRFYLLQLDGKGLTQLVTRRRGRTITGRGREELARTNVMDKVGIVSARIDSMGYRMSFSLAAGTGTVIMNHCVANARDLPALLRECGPIMERGLSMAPRLLIFSGDRQLGGHVVPPNCVGIGTVCSMTLNGIFLHESIPVVSRFGGLLEMRDALPARFVELIAYSGSSLDPFEVFIKADMTRVRSVARTGAGVICASFREFPAAALNDVQRIRKRMKIHGLGGILSVGRPNQPLYDVPVSDGYCGMIVVGGLNPLAAAREAGIEVSFRSLAELVDYREFAEMKQVLRNTNAAMGCRT